jgi:hypothetical protein
VNSDDFSLLKKPKTSSFEEGTVPKGSAVNSEDFGLPKKNKTSSFEEGTVPKGSAVCPLSPSSKLLSSSQNPTSAKKREQGTRQV